MAPATVVAYRVTVARVLDLSGGYHADAWGPEWEDWDCDWRALAFAQNIEPPSWELADLAREAGAAAILFPSLKQLGPANLNLVLYTGALGQDDVLAVHDPVGQLPKNQESWK